ncbi:serine:threonine protein kinase D3 [Trichuris trichiura]|uniref:protein kinase C n=1 Tax=Trichuris trichiura TaxID=36087 RepID=A0A077Z0J2_TRITR|nr:serine:threonine protein kinase D3 [Trichuris trichiura]
MYARCARVCVACPVPFAFPILLQYPEGEKGDALESRLLLFKHDLNSLNILQLLVDPCDLTDQAMVEIVVSPIQHNQRIFVYPHLLFVHSYRTPTFCYFCGEMLFGLVKQGLKCQACGLNYHKRCARKIPNNCSGCYRWKTRLFSLNINHFLGIIPRKDRSSSWSGRPIWMELEDAKRTKVPHTFRLHTYAKPTVCHYCKKLLKGLVRQGLQCADCNYNCHKKCEQYVPNDCSGTISEPASALALGGKIQQTLFTSRTLYFYLWMTKGLNRTDDPCRHQQSSSEQEISSFSSAVEGIPSRFSPNIPLMRLVMTKRRTKACNKVLQEGWAVFHTAKNKLRRRHYWCLTPKSIVMYADETCTRRCREVPLSRVLAVRQSPSASPLLELRTVSSNYFVVGKSYSTGMDASSSRPPKVSYGCAQRHFHRLTVVSFATIQISDHLCQADSPETTCRSEDEFLQTYQVFMDDMIGSGQFGIVYSGNYARFYSLQGMHRLCIYIAMEKLKGDMLEMILSSQKGRLNERISRFLIYQILVALNYLHAQNVVHCDLKPENILLVSDSDFPQMKLCDFGFARIIGERSFRRSIVGTPAYLAPEVLHNKGFNRSLDMWSVGVITYVALSGTFPFNEEEDILDQIKSASFLFPSHPWSDVSDKAIEFIQSLLQVKISKRISVQKALIHDWLQTYQLWCDLRLLEKKLACRYLTHESDDKRWAQVNDGVGT